MRWLNTWFFPLGIMLAVGLIACEEGLRGEAPSEPPISGDVRYVLLVAPEHATTHAFRDFSLEDCRKAQAFVIRQMLGSRRAYCVPLVLDKPKPAEHPHD